MTLGWESREADVRAIRNGWDPLSGGRQEMYLHKDVSGEIDPHCQITKCEHRELLRTGTIALTPREQAVLTGIAEHGVAWMSEQMGVTKARVRQIAIKARWKQEFQKAT